MGAIYKELRNLKALTLETPIVTPINEIKITVSKPGPTDTNLKLVTVA